MSNDEFEAKLAAALGLADGNAAPSEKELHDLTQLVKTQWPAATTESNVTMITPNRRNARFVGIAIAAAVVFGSSGVAAAATGTELPEPVRAAAHSVGLPVDSPEQHQADKALAKLRKAIATGNAAEIVAATDNLKKAADKLDSADKAELLSKAAPVIATSPVASNVTVPGEAESAELAKGDDKGAGTEAGDDKGSGTEAGDGKGAGTEVGEHPGSDDSGTHQSGKSSTTTAVSKAGSTSGPGSSGSGSSGSGSSGSGSSGSGSSGGGKDDGVTHDNTTTTAPKSTTTTVKSSDSGSGGSGSGTSGSSGSGGGDAGRGTTSTTKVESHHSGSEHA